MMLSIMTDVLTEAIGKDTFTKVSGVNGSSISRRASSRTPSVSPSRVFRYFVDKTLLVPSFFNFPPVILERTL